ncbi:hypothetical protein F5Y14DRAFT_326865 [Nemania sp. NC0429]|nr:hypothetical protein F5Y14DRAFT_326865 [Nemania sp. NC0429]
MIDPEKRLSDEWFHRRIVLIGDAVRKFESHAGLGYNADIMDVVVLVSGLRRLLLQEAEAPSTLALEGLFQRIQHEKMLETRKIEKMSKNAARILAWPIWKEKMMITWILPYLPLARLTINISVGPLISRSSVFEGLEERHLPISDLPLQSHPNCSEDVGAAEQPGSAIFQPFRFLESR